MKQLTLLDMKAAYTYVQQSKNEIKIDFPGCLLDNWEPLCADPKAFINSCTSSAN